MRHDQFQRLADLERDYWWHRGRRAIIAGILEDVGAAASSWIVDVGCGTGGNLPVLALFGRVVGIDAESAALEFVRASGQPRLLKATGDALPLADGIASVVAVLDVVEHADDDVAVLRECFRVLRPDGVLVLTVPAYQWLWSGHDEVLGHRRRYVKHEVDTRLREAGFEVRFSSYVVTCVLPAMVLYRVLERSVRHQQQSSYVPVPRLLNHALTALLKGEAALVRRGIRLPFGTSIIALARRPR